MRNTMIIGVFGLLLCSCGTTDEIIDETTEEIVLPDRIASGSAEAYAYNMNRTDSTLSRIDYEYYTPQFSSAVMDSVYKDSVNTRIVSLAGMQSPEKETQLLGPLTDEYFQRVVDDFTVDEEDDMDELDMYQWSMEMTFDILESEKHVLLTASGWSYTGGAHGNGFVSYEYYSKDDGRSLTLSDFFTDLTQLNAIAEKYFREQQEMPEEQTYDAAGFWFDNNQFAVNENFRFEGENLVFLFNPYEIAPYAAGTIELTIPKTDVAAILAK